MSHFVALVLFTAAVLPLFFLVPGVRAAHVNPQTVMTGLNNPRKLAFDQRGNLYVAEAGSGLGRPPTADDAPVARPEGLAYGGNTVYGNVVDRVFNKRRRAARETPSVAHSPAIPRTRIFLVRLLTSEPEGAMRDL